MLSAWPTRGKRAILVAGGIYAEQVELLEGVSLYGGFVPGGLGWLRGMPEVKSEIG